MFGLFVLQSDFCLVGKVSLAEVEEMVEENQLDLHFDPLSTLEEEERKD